MVRSQIDNLTPDPSFGHNFNPPNASCEFILDIYVSRSFQWYEKLFNSMIFNPCNYSLKIQESIGGPSRLQLPKWELTWECVGSFPHTFLHSQKHEM